MKKRILSMFSALCLALTLLPPLTAQADGETHSHPKCGASCSHTGGVQHDESVTWTAWDGTSDIVYSNGTAYVYLSDNVELTDSKWEIKDGNTLYLCLNGKTVTFNYGNNVEGAAVEVSGGVLKPDSL